MVSKGSFKHRLIQVAALMSCLYLTGCASPEERAEALREQCDSYNRPRGMDGRCQNLPAVTAPGKTQ